MATMEQVEKLREKANVSYDEAKQALEASNDNLLDALIYLERKGLVQPPPHNGYYNSGQQQVELETPAHDYSRANRAENKQSFTDILKRFLKWCGRVIEKGNKSTFEVKRGDEYVIAVPVTVLVLLLCFCFMVVIPLLFIGLFFGYRYYFKGFDLEKTDVNRVMGAAADAAQKFKEEVFDNRKAK